jgi:hypothetical protein
MANSGSGSCQRRDRKLRRGSGDRRGVGYKRVAFEQRLSRHSAGAAKPADAAMQAVSATCRRCRPSSRVVEIPSRLIVRKGIFSHPGQDIGDGQHGLHRGPASGMFHRRGALLRRPTGRGDRGFCARPTGLRSTNAGAWESRSATHRGIHLVDLLDPACASQIPTAAFFVTTHYLNQLPYQTFIRGNASLHR